MNLSRKLLAFGKKSADRSSSVSKARLRLETLEDRTTPVHLEIVGATGGSEGNVAGTFKTNDMNEPVTDSRSYSAGLNDESGGGHHRPQGTIGTVGATAYARLGPNKKISGSAGVAYDPMFVGETRSLTASASFNASGGIKLVADPGDKVGNPVSVNLSVTSEVQGDGATVTYQLGTLSGGDTSSKNLTFDSAVGSIIPFSFNGLVNLPSPGLLEGKSGSSSVTMDATFSQPDIDADNLYYRDALNGGPGYIAGFVGLPSAIASSVKAALYWASGPEATDVIGSPALTKTIPWTTSPATVLFPDNELSTRPANATHVVVIFDPDNEISEALEFNNSTTMDVSLDVDVTGLSETATGVEAAYQISGGLSLGSMWAKFFWATGPALADKIGEPALRRLLGGSDLSKGETHTLAVNWSELSSRPAGATHLLVVAEQSLHPEANSANNVASLELASDFDVRAVELLEDQTLYSGIYEITGTQSVSQLSAAIYWASGPAVADRIGSPAKQYTLTGGDVTNDGEHYLDFELTDLSARPAGATHLQFVVDSAGALTETDEANNTASLLLPAEAITVTATSGLDDLGTTTDNQFGTYIRGIHMLTASKPDLNFIANVSGGSVASFEFTVNGERLRRVPYNAQGSAYSLDPYSMPAGNHQLKVVALSASGTPVGEPYLGTIKVIDQLPFTLKAKPVGSNDPLIDVADLRLIDGVPVTLEYRATVTGLPLPNYYKTKFGVAFEKAPKSLVNTPISFTGNTAVFNWSSTKTPDVTTGDGDDYSVYLTPGSGAIGDPGLRLSAPTSLFVTKLPLWMGNPTAKSFQPAAAIPADVFGGNHGGYELHVNLLDGKGLELPKTSGTPFGLFDGLESYLRFGVDLTVYVKLSDEAQSAKVRADQAYVDAKLLGSTLASKQQSLTSDLFEITGEVTPHNLGYPSAITVKTRNPISLINTNNKPKITRSFGPWKIEVPLYQAGPVTVEGAGSLKGRFDAELSKLEADAKIRLTLTNNKLGIDKTESYLSVNAEAKSTAQLDASAGVQLSVGPFGPFTLAQVAGAAAADFNLSSFLKFNFDDKSFSLDDASRAQLDIKYRLKYNFSLLGLYDSSSPTDPPQIAGQLESIPLFGLPGKKESFSLNNSGNYVKTGDGIDTGSANRKPTPTFASFVGPLAAPAFDSRLTLGAILQDDIRRVKVDLYVTANRETLSPNRHQLDAVLVGDDSSEISLLSRDLSGTTFITAGNPLGFEAAPETLSLEVPVESLKSSVRYRLEFRLHSDPDADGEQARIRLSGLDVTSQTPKLEAIGSGADGALDFGPDTGGFAEGVLTLKNTGDGQLNLGKLTLAGRGFTLVNAPANRVALAPGDSFALRIRVASTAKAAIANLSIPSNDPTTPLLNVPLRYASGAVAQQVSFAEPRVNASEHIPSKLTVLLAEPAKSKITVLYAVTGGTAVAGVHYKSFGGTLTFSPGQSMKMISVPTLDNKDIGWFRTIIVTLDSPVGASLGAHSSTAYTIRDNDPMVSFVGANTVATESDAKQVVYIPVDLSAVSLTAVSVSFKVTGGTAKVGKDFTLANGRLTFAPGQMRKTIALTLLPDLLPEGDETIQITLSSPSGGILGASSVMTLTVHDRP